MKTEGTLDSGQSWHPCMTGHVFSYAGYPPDGRIPEGWPCDCKQTVAHWTKCSECGHDYVKAVPVAQPTPPH